MCFFFHLAYNSTALETVAYLLQTDTTACEKAFTHRTITSGTENKSARVSTYECPQTAEGVRYLILPELMLPGILLEGCYGQSIV